jgi:methionine-rich copper-binding protein CopC
MNRLTSPKQARPGLRRARRLDSNPIARRWMAALFIVTLAAIALVQSASAHAQLDHCTPAPGTAVATAPTEVRCWYTEEIDSKQSTLTITDANGARVDNNDGHLDLNDPEHKQLVATLKPLSTGVYKVTWHTVTSDDGGVSDGTWYFGVGQVTVPTPAPAQASEATAASTDASLTPTTAATPTSAGGTSTIAAATTTGAGVTPTTAPAAATAAVTATSPIAATGTVTTTEATPTPTPPSAPAASGGIPWVLVAGALEVIILIIVAIVISRPS